MDHNHYIRHCIDLAKLGESRTFPNPIVGCVIVNTNGDIIGEGFHEYYGGAHAEVVAIDNVLRNLKEAIAHKALKADIAHNYMSLKSFSSLMSPNEIFSECTIYVSLEPCSHHGKTPPCADLIIKHKFKRLVYACSDPNPLVTGKGIERIKDAGIEVVGPDELDAEIVKEAEFVNRAFFAVITSPSERSKEGRSNPIQCEPGSQRRSAPRDDGAWLTLKIALTPEGSMISDEKFISNSNARKDVHQLRSTHQLLITGINTIKIDNPFLNVRFSPEELGFKETKDPDLLILNNQQSISKEEEAELNIFKAQSRTIHFEKLSRDFKNLEEIIQKYAAMNYQKIMIEAGPALSKAFLDSRLVDELVVYSASGDIKKTLEKFYPGHSFELLKEYEIKGKENERNNLKAIFSCNSSLRGA